MSRVRRRTPPYAAPRPPRQPRRRTSHLEVEPQLVEFTSAGRAGPVRRLRARRRPARMPALAARAPLRATPLTAARRRALRDLAAELRRESRDDLEFGGAVRADGARADRLRVRRHATRDHRGRSAAPAAAGCARTTPTSCSRSAALAGVPARYVSGHLLGEGGTHAWVEVLVPHGAAGPGRCVRPVQRPPGRSAPPHRGRRPRLRRRRPDLRALHGCDARSIDGTEAAGRDCCRLTAGRRAHPAKSIRATQIPCGPAEVSKGDQAQQRPYRGRSCP